MTKKRNSRGKSQTTQLSPNEFLRARRPEKFSDSDLNDEPVLDRSILEYHLDTMTSRSQEVAFATFARYLTEREICPNLLPQTGPTGGGDSKVDAETYPVAEELALGWHVGIQGASERWGFAFSAKRRWKDKVVSDANEAIGTRRGYTKIFFVSNQYIRDKARAEVEDKLKETLNVEVHILDRTWILDKVFSNDRRALAVEHLQIATSTRKEVRKGPRDTQREIDLQEIEKRIQDAIAEGHQGLQLAEDCIDAAQLARGLERPRTEIDGMYERAERITAKYGTSHQILKCAYQKAWTTYWWYEDYERFSELYERAEEIAKGSQNAYDLELLTSLWQILHTMVVTGKSTERDSSLSKRTDTLASELERLCLLEDQPSTALHARSLRLLMSFSLTSAAKEPLEPILREFREVIRSCEGLIGFPLEPLAEFLTELGDAFGGLPAYDELFDSIVDVQSHRKGDVVAARMLLRRGSQQLTADHPYDAIRTLGLSLKRLYKHESRDDAVRALYLSGCAYERVGLLWAARGTLLSAASLAASEWWKYGEITRAQAACYRKLKWIELQLGRVPHTWAWHEVDVITRMTLIAKGDGGGDLSEVELAYDAILGILLLRASDWQLEQLSVAPDLLDRLGLFSASAALMYALGYEDELQKDFFGKAETHEGMSSFFRKWRDQPASKDLPKRPSLYEEQKVTLHSRLLGCDITVTCENASPCVELAESLLAALESLLSTGTVHAVAVREPLLSIDVRSSDFAQQPFEFELQDETGRPQINILAAKFEPHSMSRAVQGDFKEALLKLLATIFARIVMANDVEQLFKGLLRDELALDRSISFTGSFVTVANVLGKNPKTRMSSWSSSEDSDYPPKRAVAWDADFPESERRADSNRPPFKPGQGDPPPELLDHSRVKQSEIRTVSLIREALWDKAGWIGTGFGVGERDESPPMLALMFKNEEAAKKIFTFWSSELGRRDPDARLRVAIVRGINAANPHWYRVLIGSSPNSELGTGDVRYFAFVGRINTMQPDSGTNLNRFLESYSRVKGYILTAALAQGDPPIPTPIDCPFLIKNDLHVREAWEIGRHDPDGIVVHADDTPIVPSGQRNPPVAELLRWKQSRAKISQD
jgi:hypothetical protein